MNSGERTGRSKTAMLVTGLITFVIGLIFAAVFSGVFNSRLIPFAILVAAVVFLVSKFRCGSCCGR